MAFGPPMKLICATPLPSALNFWIQGVMCFTYVAVSAKAETSFRVVSCAAATPGRAAMAHAATSLFMAFLLWEATRLGAGSLICQINVVHGMNHCYECPRHGPQPAARVRCGAARAG